MSYQDTHAAVLGASEVATIVTGRDGAPLSPWGSEWAIWAAKRGVRVQGDKPEQRRGRYLERAVCDWYGDEMGAELVAPSVWAGRPMPLAGPAPVAGTMDRIARVEGQPRVLEAKTARSSDGWGEPGTDQIPLYYAVQAQLYLRITGLDLCDVAVLFTLSERFEIYRLESSARVQDELLRRAREWWDRHIIHGEEPPADGSESCGEAIAAMFPAQKGPLRLASVEEAELVTQVASLKAAQKLGQSGLDEAENRLKLAIGDAEGLRYGQGLRATWKAQSRTSIDAKALRTDHPDIARQYERTSSFRVLHVKES